MTEQSTTAQPVSVLVVEDDPAAAEVVAIALRARGYQVQVCPTGRAALDAAATVEPDIVVLDLGLPDLDGIDVCAALRRWSSNPIVVLSADGADDRKVRALDEGADDYVTKPYSMDELLARLRVAQRHRRVLSAIVDPGVVTLGDLAVDFGAHAATAGGERLELTRKEFVLLSLLVRNPGRVLTHATIIGHVWEGAAGGGSAPLRVHVTNLRRKLGTGSARPGIETEPGVGYRLMVPESAAPA